MKTRGTSVRFVLLSATAPNIEDIAAWVGYSEGSVAESSTRMFKFGDEFRPCQITRHVYAYPRKQQNEYQFNRSLDFKVFELLMKHCGGKPALVFCPTRKGVTTAADTVMKQYKQQLDQKKNMPWPPPKLSAGSFQDKQLTSLASCGIGVHHAGLNLEDRRLTEEFFLSGQLQVVFATSTLAVGVNLPARTTIIKGTQMWGTAGWMEYSDLDIMQMIGRAGRPQFDKEGVAVIMCSSDMEHRYQTLSSGQTVIESNLHLNLTEHINSEIGLGTIRSLESAHHWLRNSFLFQRVKQNPVHYGKRIAESAEGGLSPSGSWQNRLDVLVDESLKSLVDLGVVESDKKGFRATEYGEIMSRVYTLCK
ncbi:Sec63 [Tulasnella sp. 419]|nr:Sec63 [Tulasnella sp. 419]